MKREEEYRRSKNDLGSGTFFGIIVFAVYAGLIFEKDTYSDLEALEGAEQKCYDFIIGNMSLYAISIVMMWISYYAISKQNIRLVKCFENLRGLACLIWGFVGIDFCWSDQMIALKDGRF